MPPIGFSAFKCQGFLTTSISLNGEIINPYSCYVKKGLVCIIIIFLFSRQPFFYFKYTKANTCLLYDVLSVPFNKYKFLHYTHYCAY